MGLMPQGYYWDEQKGKWRVQFQFEGKRHYVGMFFGREDAEAAASFARSWLAVNGTPPVDWLIEMGVIDFRAPKRTGSPKKDRTVVGVDRKFVNRHGQIAFGMHVGRKVDWVELYAPEWIRWADANVEGFKDALAEWKERREARKAAKRR